VLALSLIFKVLELPVSSNTTGHKYPVSLVLSDSNKNLPPGIILFSTPVNTLSILLTFNYYILPSSSYTNAKYIGAKSPVTTICSE